MPSQHCCIYWCNERYWEVVFLTDFRHVCRDGKKEEEMKVWLIQRVIVYFVCHFWMVLHIHSFVLSCSFCPVSHIVDPIQFDVSSEHADGVGKLTRSMHVTKLLNLHSLVACGKVSAVQRIYVFLCLLEEKLKDIYWDCSRNRGTRA